VAESVVSVVTEFSSTWKHVLLAIGEAIVGSFPNLENGKTIRRRIYQDIYLNYKGFAEIVKQHYPTIFSSQQLVAVTALKSEIARLLEDPVDK